MNKEHWRNETVGFLAVASIKGVGFWTMHHLAGLGIGFKNLLKDTPYQEMQKLLKVSLPDEEQWEEDKQALWSTGQATARDLAHQGIMLLFPEQEAFPDKLKAISDPPRWLFVQGSIASLFSPSVAIVGTRKPSDDGIFLTRYLLSLLANQGVVTVSGLATGIDRVVHDESLRYGIPTVAVLGNGFNVDYPKGSLDLRKSIVAQGGTVVSEYLPSQKGSAETFVRRNRLQAGLAETVIPVEWKVKSGTAHTVKFSSQYGKRLVNIYLPGTTSVREEISFSEKEYSASSFQVPLESSRLLDVIHGEDCSIYSPTQMDMSFSGDEND
ncbi:DNA-processing protein DprA [Halomonas heilongjiangensis]|uniref:DNA-processing protein DprA n=1 Tax=Halomonas heilongjiangensis TaxID=1387883 RepID=A0A2N7TU62_9GAMM|nr:DNA-processing protein DprA [Halomonas heilongjiangensis]PMR71732.1 DNA-processing protein DprA [Halomonas heilongjiangensis]PXX89987.1 DNA processing protein DprA [Halomonas heilongjiangensis]